MPDDEQARLMKRLRDDARSGGLIVRMDEQGFLVIAHPVLSKYYEEIDREQGRSSTPPPAAAQ